jgi:asparagine synthetase B (glutamine-hydrolysing)
MFLVAITKQSIAHAFRAPEACEFRVDPQRILTILTDKFLSSLSIESTKITVAESPAISSSSTGIPVFSEISFDQKSMVLEIFKSTMAGRPVYYYRSQRGDFYCSTHIVMLRKAGVPLEENTKVLPGFFVYRYVMPPNTLYKNIKQLLAGSRIKIQIRNNSCDIIEIHEYIPPNPICNKILRKEAITTQLLSLLVNTIQPLNLAKSRIAPLLSGGLDSSILCVLCKNELHINETYSTAYPFEDSNTNREMEYAVSAATALKTHHEFYETTTRDYLFGLLESVQAAEEPLHHLQSVMFYLLFKQLPGNKNIILCGQGADGVFGLGLHNSLFRSESFAYRLLLKSPMIALLESVARIGGKGGSFTNELRLLNGRYKHISDPKNIVWSLGAYGSIEWVSRYFKASDEDIISERFYGIQLFQDRSLYDVISVLDFLGDVSITTAIWSKLAEACGKTIYYPFNNIDILNYAYSIPWATKLMKPKNILRGVAGQLGIPEFIITRPKSGFGIRADRWARREGIFEPLVPLAMKVFDPEQIRCVQNVDSRNAMTFWNILNYSIWKRLFLNNESLAVLKNELEEALCKTPCG